MKENNNLKIFIHYVGMKEINEYGMIYGVVIAESKEEAEEIMKQYTPMDIKKMEYDAPIIDLFDEIPMTKGYHLVGSYIE